MKITVCLLGAMILIAGHSINGVGINNAQAKEPASEPAALKRQSVEKYTTSIASQKESYIEIDTLPGGTTAKESERISNAAKIFAGHLYTLSPKANRYILTALSSPRINENIVRRLSENSFEMEEYIEKGKPNLGLAAKSNTGKIKIANGCKILLQAYDMQQEEYLISNFKTGCTVRMAYNGVIFKFDTEQNEVTQKPFHLKISKDKARELEKELSAGSGRGLDVVVYGKPVRAESSPEKRPAPEATVWMKVEAVELIKIDHSASSGFLPVKKSLLFIDGPELARSFR